MRICFFSKLLALVTEKVVAGWDDPRLSTLSAMRRRGVPPEAIRDFCERVGVARRSSTIQIELFERCIRCDIFLFEPCFPLTIFLKFAIFCSCVHCCTSCFVVREYLYPRAQRRFAVQKPLLVKITNLSQEEKVTVPNHPEDQSFGSREVRVL